LHSQYQNSTGDQASAGVAEPRTETISVDRDSTIEALAHYSAWRAGYQPPPLLRTGTMVILPRPDFAPGIPRPSKMTFWSGPVPEGRGQIYRTFDWSPAPLTKATWAHACQLAETSYAAFFRGLNVVPTTWSLAPKGSVDLRDPLVREAFMLPIPEKSNRTKKQEQPAEMAA
jgi:hypothetical protein